MRALQPAKVKEVHLAEDSATAPVLVHDFQLSLAIGKEGQNARLAARLTGWRIDIKSETQLAEEGSGYAGEEWAEGEWIQNEAGEMVWQPAEGGTAVSATEWSQGAEGAEGAEGKDSGTPAGTEGAAGEPAAAADRSEGPAETAPAETAPTEAVRAETVPTETAHAEATAEAEVAGSDGDGADVPVEAS